VTKGERLVLADVSTAVYRFFDAENQLLYLGITHDLEKRWGAHERSQPWWLDVVRRQVAWYDTRKEAEHVEVAATATERPRYDRSGKRTDGREWEDRLALEIDRAVRAVSEDIEAGTYPLWSVLPPYGALSQKYGIPVVGIARGLSSLAYHQKTLAYQQDVFAVSRPGCIPSRDAQKVGLLFFLASNAFGDRSFTLTDLAETTAYSRGSAHQHLKRWEKADRVECVGQVPGKRSLVYRIIRHPEPDPPEVLTYWRRGDVLALSQWLNQQAELMDRDREIINACMPDEYGVSNAGVRVLKVMAGWYAGRPGCLPEWGISG
jgi:hypothetical protein